MEMIGTTECMTYDLLQKRIEDEGDRSEGSVAKTVHLWKEGFLPLNSTARILITSLKTAV